VFGESPVLPMAVHGLPFIVLPFVVWAAIRFGVAGGTLAVLVVATIATVVTALGIGPFSTNTPLVNAVLLDVLFAVLSLSALSLAAVMAEREWAERERVRLMRERVESDARLRFAAIVESSEDAIVSVSPDGSVLTWNGAAARILGIEEAAAIGQQSATLVPPGIWGDETEVRDRIARGGRIFYVEGSRTTAEGQTMHLLSTISPLRDSTGTIVGSARIVRDVSQQKEAERELSGFNRRLIDAQEQERAKIARELHDDLGQRLALLTSRLAEVSTDLQAQAAEIADDLQALSRELHPSKIDLLGITASMRFFCRDFAQERGVRVEFDARDVPSRLPWDLSVTLYRILQEALHNVAKHSGVRQCRVQLWAAEGLIHLRIEDRGAGFDVQAAKRGRGIGLISMEERVKLVDGSLTVESSPGRGAAVYARAPFDAPALG
jgi:PAS domain S-box-containing protein